jgi:hypothetical protein
MDEEPEETKKWSWTELRQLRRRALKNERRLERLCFKALSSGK